MPDETMTVIGWKMLASMKSKFDVDILNQHKRNLDAALDILFLDPVIPVNLLFGINVVKK